MARTWWNKPVTVETQKVGQRLSINSVERATEYLLQGWPAAEKGRAFKVAKKALLDAYDGKIDAENARKAFIAALKESNIYIFDE